MANKKSNIEQAVALLNSGQEVTLNTPGIISIVQKKLMEEIDEWCVKTFDGGHRSHLGASLIGHECSRYLWGIFRWLKREDTDGRKQRLFNRGHREEERFVQYLEGIGCQVWFEDRESNPLYFCEEIETYYLKSQLKEGSIESEISVEVSNLSNKNWHLARAKADGIEFPQYRISDVMGHFGGSLDGIVILPERYGIKEPLLLEFKTNGTGKGFNELKERGMQLAKGQHFAQTSTYGFKYKFNYCLYLNTNKNDDDIHLEIVKLNHNTGQQMIAKAERIITSQEPPPRISDNPTYFACTYCSQKEICHKNAPPEKNCRSCINAVPVENAQWLCKQWNAIIPNKEAIIEACPQYKAITSNA